ncbi:Uncharacterised protein [Mycobacteroides abscessus subsp. abscessus]|nr:Uncharacterised protein [Mycobacteroides abscessus subsp. abscessus]
MLIVQLGEFTEDRLLAHTPFGTLDELEHRDIGSVVPGTQSHAKGGRRLAFSGTGMHCQNRRVATCLGGQAVLRHHQWLPLWHPNLLC